MQQQQHRLAHLATEQVAKHYCQPVHQQSSNPNGYLASYIASGASASLHQHAPPPPPTQISYLSSSRTNAQLTKIPVVTTHGYPAQQRIQQHSCSGLDNLFLAAMINDATSAPVAPPVLANPVSPYTRLVAGSEKTCVLQQRFVGLPPAQARDASCPVKQQPVMPPSSVPAPNSKSEMELYNLLENANLLNYFGTFLSLGGDDVHQLLDADEEEFLEIMNLVGMIHKPLHVRRLQKALLDWRDTSADLDISFHTSHQLLDTPESVPASPTKGSTRSKGFCSPPVAIRRSMSPHDLSIDQQSGTLLPHEVLIGAPKRLRLMDNLHRETSEPLSAAPICTLTSKDNINNNRNETSPSDFSRSTKARKNIAAISRGRTSGPKQVDSADSDSERFIDVTDSNVEAY